MKSVNHFCNAVIQTGKTDEHPNTKGNTVHRMFLPAERYLIDFADDFTVEGWQQFDTDQDASYFGVWVNPKTRQTLCYAEGDWTLCECADDEHYNAEIQGAIDFHDDGFICKAIDANGLMTVYVQDRSTFLIGGAV